MQVHIPDVPKSSPIYREIQTLRENIPEILKHPNEWVLIHGKTVGGFFKSKVAGLTEGYRRFGLKQFIVQDVNVVMGKQLKFSVSTQFAVCA